MSSTPDNSQALTHLLSTRTDVHHRKSSALIRLSLPFVLSSPAVYRNLVVSFYHIFKAMEQLLETLRLQFPKLSPIYFRELRRTPAFEQDLSYYFEHEDVPQPSAETRAYIDEMRLCVDDNPVLLVAYLQSMYMGLLAGGTIIRGYLVTAFGLTPPHGCAIFDFSSSIRDVSAFRQRYTDAVNSIALTTLQTEQIIAAKARVFQCNNNIVREVCASHINRKHMSSFFIRLLVVLVVLTLLVVVMYNMYLNPSAFQSLNYLS